MRPSSNHKPKINICWWIEMAKFNHFYSDFFFVIWWLFVIVIRIHNLMLLSFRIVVLILYVGEKRRWLAYLRERFEVLWRQIHFPSLWSVVHHHSTLYICFVYSLLFSHRHTRTPYVLYKYRLNFLWMLSKKIIAKIRYEKFMP